MKQRLAWDCGDELLRRLKRANRKQLRKAISDEVLTALQHHSTTDEIDHVVIYMDNAALVMDYQLPDCQRRIDLRRIIEEEIEMRGGSDEEIGKLEVLFEDLARLCREARLENRPACGARIEPGAVPHETAD